MQILTERPDMKAALVENIDVIAYLLESCNRGDKLLLSPSLTGIKVRRIRSTAVVLKNIRKLMNRDGE